MKEFILTILAAGKGTRLRSGIPKVLHELAGRPLIHHVAHTSLLLKPSAACVVVGYGAAQVQHSLAGLPLQFILQEPQIGTGHALQVAREFWARHQGTLLVVPGDVPLVRAETMEMLLAEHDSSGASATILSAIVDNPAGYGRIIRGPDCSVERIVEDRDASPEQRAIREINSGIYCFSIHDLSEVIDHLLAKNSQHELYLTDCIGLLKVRKKIAALVCPDPNEVRGVNTRLELSKLEQILRARKLEELMQSGVTIIDPCSTYIHPETEVGPDTIIYPGVFLEGRNRIGSRCKIYPHVRMNGSVLGDDVVILDSCVITDSQVHPGSQIGPFAHLCKESTVGRGVRIGNFVEIKKSQIGDHSKAAHLSYLGDSEIGTNVNIGAGTITCNYDGISKNKTVIEDGVFVGSDSQLIAPVTIHANAYIAAGSTIHQDVPSNALAIGRSRQTNKENWVNQKKPFKKKE